jgi:hypothetical protein
MTTLILEEMLEGTLITRPRLPGPSSFSACRSDPAFVRSSMQIAARLIFFQEENHGRGGAICHRASRETLRDGRLVDGPARSDGAEQPVLPACANGQLWRCPPVARHLSSWPLAQ